ncbi:hypothetical protein T484DRAFT_3253006 [Baffinella frigidus]|nr:hypothetical protein T484DRAFT_3253006 [Cryptophyta sp. CCMP2293]
MHFESHMEKFRHECPRGAVCTMLSEPEHRRLYTHPADQEDRAVKRLMESSGWASDNFRSKVCAPTYAGAAHQGNTPFPSCVPRGGDRPLGGDTHFGELSGISRRAQVPDYITVVISGIELSWGDIDFYNFVREWDLAWAFGDFVWRF